MPTYYVKIAGKDRPAMIDLARKHRVAIDQHTARMEKKGYAVNGFANGHDIRRLEGAGYKVTRIEDAVRADKAEHRKALARTRGLEPAAAPLGRYLTVDEVESALATVASGPSAPIAQLVKLPNKTWENRVSHALKIGKGSGANRPGIYFLGGVHAREWGSPDILVNFAQQLLGAYNAGIGITIGKKKFTVAQEPPAAANRPHTGGLRGGGHQPQFRFPVGLHQVLCT